MNFVSIFIFTLFIFLPSAFATGTPTHSPHTGLLIAPNPTFGEWSGAGRLPPSIYYPNTNPPIFLHSTVLSVMKSDAWACERYFGTLSLDTKYLTRLDLNNDGYEDYVLSSEGYVCSDPRGVDYSKHGHDYYFFVSSGNKNAIQLFHDDVYGRAIRFIPNWNGNYPAVVITAPCQGSGIAMHTAFGETYFSWRNNQMAKVRRNEGCLGQQRGLVPLPLIR